MRIRFPATDGTTLEGEVVAPVGRPRGVAVVCHPHPLAGGSMDTWMPPLLQRNLVEVGLRTLRFNFRGVGGSEGVHDDGEAEVGDVVGAAQAVAGDDGLPLIVGGWSFGAATSLRAVTAVPHIIGWFGIGLPVDDEDDLVGAITQADIASLFVHGSADVVCPLARTDAVVDAGGARATKVVIDGGDHFLGAHGRLIGRELRTWVDAVFADRE